MRIILTVFFLGFSSMATLGRSENTEIQQNFDPIREYFDNALEASDDDTESEEIDDNRFNRVAQTEDGEKASDASTSTETPTDAAPADAAGKTKKKKKKKKKSSTESSETSGSSGHGTQESGMPYKANVDLGLSYSSQSITRKYSDKSLKDTQTSIELDLKYLFVLGKIEVGPMLLYEQSNLKSAVSESSSSTSNQTESGFGAAFIFNLGNIHQDRFIPYAGLSVARQSVVIISKTEGLPENKSTQSELSSSLELGGKFFMGGHIALKPFVSFDITFSGENKDNSSGSELVASVTGTEIAAGLGLAKYF